MRNLVIIGSGPAGYTAAVYAGRALLNPIVVTGRLPGGQLTQTSDIENYPGFSEAVNGFELMSSFQKQAERFGSEILYDAVLSVDFKQGGPQKIVLEGGGEIEAMSVIIATGASPRWLGIDSEKRLMAKGVSACATCDGAFFKNVPIVVVGGGDTAMEEAIFLTRFASKVYLVHRRDELRASKIMADRAMKNPKIEFVWSSAVNEIIGENSVEAVLIKNLKDGKVSRLEAKGYFAALGHDPNTLLFKGKVEMDEAGYILPQGNSSRTSVDGVFAAGDCADKNYRQAVTAAGMGCKAAIDAERWLEAMAR
jgi:thioredoxin reductase (NADPH)